MLLIGMLGEATMKPVAPPARVGPVDQALRAGGGEWIDGLPGPFYGPSPLLPI